MGRLSDWRNRGVSSMRLLRHLTISVATLALMPVTAMHAGAQTPVSHVVLIVDENKTYNKVVSSTCCPFIQSMIASGVLATDDHAITSGSVHDYYALTDGDTTNQNGNAENLFHQLQTAGVSWRAYEETMPYPCYTGSSYGTDPNVYVKGHDPAVTYSDIKKNAAACANVVPLESSLPGDIASGSLPAFSFITPNECDDMHSCTATQGDSWLSTWVPQIANAIGPDGVILLTWDEGDKSTQHIPLVEYGPGVADAGLAGTRYDSRLDHYGVLAAMEDNWGLPRINHAIGAPPLPLP
jgi:phospholipase C